MNRMIFESPEERRDFDLHFLTLLLIMDAKGVPFTPHGLDEAFSTYNLLRVSLYEATKPEPLPS